MYQSNQEARYKLCVIGLFLCNVTISGSGASVHFLGDVYLIKGLRRSIALFHTIYGLLSLYIVRYTVVLYMWVFYLKILIMHGGTTQSQTRRHKKG